MLVVIAYRGMKLLSQSGNISGDRPGINGFPILLPVIRRKRYRRWIGIFPDFLVYKPFSVD
ncbi:hypothetical protein [Treponema primitia]|uniref:hypothetical protein n=1 Tax=Treponema primitia TaxID=88058 RepID=UPI0018E1A1FC|nr:hypothetical protein [Treponema primitia]